jgi:hypothetical protein
MRRAEREPGHQVLYGACNIIDRALPSSCDQLGAKHSDSPLNLTRNARKPSCPGPGHTRRQLNRQSLGPQNDTRGFQAPETLQIRLVMRPNQ